MTEVEIGLLSRFEELSERFKWYEERLETMEELLRKIKDCVQDEQVRRKFGISDEAADLLTYAEWERIHNSHEWRRAIGKEDENVEKECGARYMKGKK